MRFTIVEFYFRDMTLPNLLPNFILQSRQKTVFPSRDLMLLSLSAFPVVVFVVVNVAVVATATEVKILKKNYLAFFPKVCKGKNSNCC